MLQPVRFCTSYDGIRLGYAMEGSGPPVARTTFYLNHLELDWRCPVWKPYLDELTGRYSLLRHDMRGFGLSHHEAPSQSLDAWVRDFEAVVDAAGLERFPVIGMCHGAAIAVEYAARHPERVTHLVVLGGYVRGALRRARTAQERASRELLLKAVELGWGEDNEAFQQVWPTLLQPSSTLERLRALAEVQRQSPARNAVELLRAAGELDISESAAQVKCPTLVFHTKQNRNVPFEEGRLLASSIPNAKLVPLEGANHVLTEIEPAWGAFVRELRAFLPSNGASRGPALQGLTERESQILERIARGLDNAQIAAHLGMSEKTVRNHITRIFDKLGVENRGQAIVRAREAGIGLRGAIA